MITVTRFLVVRPENAVYNFLSESAARDAVTGHSNAKIVKLEVEFPAPVTPTVKATELER